MAGRACARPSSRRSARQTAPRLRLVTRKTEQTQMALGMRTCSRHDPRRFAVRLLNTILGENMSSRLFQVVREDHGLAYSIYSTPSFFEDTGDIVISAGLETEKLPRTLRLIFAELRQLAAQPPAKVEIAPRPGLRARPDQPEPGEHGKPDELARRTVAGLRPHLSPRHRQAALLAVTARDIQAAARELFRPEKPEPGAGEPSKTDRHLAATAEFGMRTIINQCAAAKGPESVARADFGRAGADTAAQPAGRGLALAIPSWQRSHSLLSVHLVPAVAWKPRGIPECCSEIPGTCWSDYRPATRCSRNLDTPFPAGGCFGYWGYDLKNFVEPKDPPPRLQRPGPAGLLARVL